MRCPACRYRFFPEGTSQVELLARALQQGETSQLLKLSPEFCARYRLESLLGVGGMGMVCRAQDLSVGRPVAIKFLIEIDSEEELSRFMLEAKVLAQIQNPHVMSIYDLDSLERHPYFVAELLEGGTLRAKLEQGPIPLAEACKIALQCLWALEACHKAGVLHRDIKPENILFDGQGLAKLTDLGMAKALQERNRLTRTGVVPGTPLYMAPEQLAGDTLTFTSDVYSLALVLYEMLSGKAAFTSKTMPELLARKLVGNHVPLRAVTTTVPEPVVQLVERALARDPGKRPGSAAAFAAELAQTSGVPATGPVEPLPPKRPVSIPPRRSLRPNYLRWAAAALVPAGVLALLLIWAGRPHPHRETPETPSPKPPFPSATLPPPQPELVARAGQLVEEGDRALATLPELRSRIVRSSSFVTAASPAEIKSLESNLKSEQKLAEKLAARHQELAQRLTDPEASRRDELVADARILVCSWLISDDLERASVEQQFLNSDDDPSVKAQRLTRGYHRQRRGEDAARLQRAIERAGQALSAGAGTVASPGWAGPELLSDLNRISRLGRLRDWESASWTRIDKAIAEVRDHLRSLPGAGAALIAEALDAVWRAGVWSVAEGPRWATPPMPLDQTRALRDQLVHAVDGLTRLAAPDRQPALARLAADVRARLDPHLR